MPTRKDWADAAIAVHDYAGGFTWVGAAYARLYLGELRQLPQGGAGGAAPPAGASPPLAPGRQGAAGLS